MGLVLRTLIALIQSGRIFLKNPVSQQKLLAAAKWALDHMKELGWGWASVQVVIMLNAVFPVIDVYKIYKYLYDLISNDLTAEEKAEMEKEIASMEEKILAMGIDPATIDFSLPKEERKIEPAQPILNNSLFHNFNNTQRHENPAPKRDPYQRQDTRVEYQIFSNEYFSGADVHIYFGDIWIDEITDIQFTLQEEVLPIYGYNSYTFDSVARGKRMVRGMFTMNFTSTAYLQQVLENAEAIKYALETANDGKPIDPKFYDKFKLDEILKIYGKDSFEKIAEDYERAIWGEEEDEHYSYLAYPNTAYWQRNDPYGFDIRIQYGNAHEEQKGIQRQVYKSNDPNAMKPNITVETINGIQINALSKQSATSQQGAPIQETYGFIARDINGASLTK